MDTPLSETINSQLVLNEEQLGILYKMTAWTRFLAIINFLLSGIYLLVSFVFPFIPDKTGEKSYGIGVKLFAMFVLILFSTGIFLFGYFLLKFSKGIRAYKEEMDSSYITKAFLNLKRYFSFQGIIIASVVGFYLLLFVFAIIAGLIGALNK